jgi:SAM-dependent methyltransferase
VVVILLRLGGLLLTLAIVAIGLYMAATRRYLGADRFLWSARVQGLVFAAIGLAGALVLASSLAGGAWAKPAILAGALLVLLAVLLALLRLDPLERGLFRAARNVKVMASGPIFTPKPLSQVPTLTTEQIPIPPREMRELTGRVEVEEYENPSGELVYPYLDRALYESVLDFGCGCGRVARQMLLQSEPPQNYLGIDLHRGEIEWCRRNLKPVREGVEFLHHDVFNPVLNADPTRPRHLPFPAPDASFTMVTAMSTFTHLVESEAVYYLNESTRVLKENGVLHATWFLFDKSEFSALRSYQHALYISDSDPTHAVYFDRQWVLEQATRCGFSVSMAIVPGARGFQWTLVMRKDGRGLHVDLPADTAPVAERLPW